MNQERKKNIAILMGGDSVERKISIKSGEYFYSNLNSNNYNSYKILVSNQSEWFVKFKNERFDINKQNFSIQLKNEIIKFDAAVILI
jgi:D-alanine-D-alanine ligase